MIELVIDARRKDLGGFEVGRILPFAKRRMVGPFTFLDHMGPAFFDSGVGIDVRPHPHIGLSTVTYLFEGEILHQDNLGYRQAIRPGEVNWMTAGSGIVHSERTDQPVRRTGGPVHGLQAWVALPVENEEDDPAFFHHEGADLPTFDADGVWGRLIAGRAFGLEARVKTHSPLFYMHWEMQPGARYMVPADYPEAAAYVVQGQIEVDGRSIHSGQMVVFDDQAQAILASAGGATVMLLGGEPVGPRILWWNLVSHSQGRIDQAKADWKAGRMALPPEDDSEFIPLPEDPPPPKPPPL